MWERTDSIDNPKYIDSEHFLKVFSSMLRKFEDLLWPSVGVFRARGRETQRGVVYQHLHQRARNQNPISDCIDIQTTAKTAEEESGSHRAFQTSPTPLSLPFSRCPNYLHRSEQRAHRS